MKPKMNPGDAYFPPGSKMRKAAENYKPRPNYREDYFETDQRSISTEKDVQPMNSIAQKILTAFTYSVLGALTVLTILNPSIFTVICLGFIVGFRIVAEKVTLDAEKDYLEDIYYRGKRDGIEECTEIIKRIYGGS